MILVDFMVVHVSSRGVCFFSSPLYKILYFFIFVAYGLVMVFLMLILCDGSL